MLTKLRYILQLIVVVAFVACGGGGGGNKAPAGDTTQIQRGGVLKVTMNSNPVNFDPMLQNDGAGDQVTQNVFEGLYKYDKDLKPVPYLAESVDVSGDGLEWTFHLRKGIKFHDGTEMDADAVKFSMDRIRDNPKSIGNGDAKPITQTLVLSKYDFKLVLNEPFAPLPSRLTKRLGAVVSPTAVKMMGDENFNRRPVGTGPFKFAQFVSDSNVKLTKFDGYWQKGADGEPLPYLDSVEFQIKTEASVRFLALQGGDVDIATLRDADVPMAKKDSNLVVSEGPGFGWNAIFLTINKAPFDNKALRQALAYAVDRNEINKAIYDNQRTIANGPIPPSFEWAIDPTFKPYAYDPDKAKKLLVEGGKPEGFDFEYLIPSGDATLQLQSELVQAQLAKLGIKMNVKAVDMNGVLIPALQKGTNNAYQLSLTLMPDPDDAIAKPFGKGSGFNTFPYENQRVEELIKQGRRTTDLKERAKVYQEATRQIMDDSPLVLTVYVVDRYAGNKNVQGWYIGFKATSGYAEYWKKQ